MPDTEPTPRHTSGQQGVGAGEQGRGIHLAGYAFLILFFELALIRYLPAYVRIVGFYINFVLIATFLGMSLGLLRADLADRLRWAGLVVFVTLVSAVKYFSAVDVGAPRDPDHWLWSGAIGISENVTRIGILPVALLLFALTTAAFVPLGALFGREFRGFEPLKAYSIDIAGSLCGILAFALMSWGRSSPVVWFASGFAVWILLSVDSKRFLLGLVSTAAVTLAIVVWTGSGPMVEAWSPYYRITLQERPSRYELGVNGSFHQFVADLDPAGDDMDDPRVRLREGYLRPYRLIDVPDTALVVGAGTGNDVAVLLQVGAGHVDAVEIDPTILDIGRALHFQEPYSDPRVDAINTDARAHLRTSGRRYDAIVFGTLDSHTQLAGMGSLRLDNYVYTREAFEAARARLKPGGTLITYHLSGEPYIAEKIRQMLTDVFGRPPVVLVEPEPMFHNLVFLAGEMRVDPSTLAQADVAGADESVTPVDDWPYLYLRRRTVPGHYSSTLLGVLAIALGATFLAVRGAPRTAEAHPPSLHALMFFMGVGFLLVETKSVTEMSLLFGSTWMVNVLVFSSILTMILLANLWVMRHPPQRTAPLFVGLFAALALAYAVPVHDLLWLGQLGKWVLGALLVGLPVLFAALIFATLFRATEDAARALAFNVMGAVCGGVLEYSSMIFGIKALYLVAALAYGGAWLSARRFAAPEGVEAATGAA